MLECEIEVAVRTLDDISDAAELAEDHFLARHRVAINLQPPQCLSREAADEQARVLPAWIAIAGVERDAGRRECRE